MNRNRARSLGVGFPCLWRSAFVELPEQNEEMDAEMDALYLFAFAFMHLGRNPAIDQAKKQ